MRTIFLPLVLFTAALCSSVPVRAAESYDNCTGTIASVPTVISTQGVWCLKSDLATSISVGTAILVSANNVIIDCNGFKLGGLGAGMSTSALGIESYMRMNLTVRDCNVRGFRIGILLNGGSGHVIEDNRIEASRQIGVFAYTDGALIRGNRIMDTGGATNDPMGIAFAGDTDIHDNLIADVVPGEGTDPAAVYGIYAGSGTNSSIRGNILRGLSSLDHSGVIIAVRVPYLQPDVADNYVAAVPSAGSTATAFYCLGGSGFVRNNRAVGFDAFAHNCPAESSGNELR